MTFAPNKVLRLHEALYGLRHAPCVWNAMLDSTLLYLGFRCAAITTRHVHAWKGLEAVDH
jgi:hypothetical protein